MITLVQRDLFKLPADTLVNTVNCVGPWGKGVALGCKTRWPAAYEAWRQWLAEHTIRPGGLWVYELPTNTPPFRLACLATKDHWKDPSRLEWVALAAMNFRDWLETRPVTEVVAMPALGCGNGGLQWVEVRNRLTRVLQHCPQQIYLVEPA